MPRIGIWMQNCTLHKQLSSAIDQWMMQAKNFIILYVTSTSCSCTLSLTFFHSFLELYLSGTISTLYLYTAFSSLLAFKHPIPHSFISHTYSFFYIMSPELLVILQCSQTCSLTLPPVAIRMYPIAVGINIIKKHFTLVI